jgi:hypothetical protein
MSHTGLSASSITTYISGISTMHKLNGQTDNTKSFLVTNILPLTVNFECMLSDFQITLKKVYRTYGFIGLTTNTGNQCGTMWAFCNYVSLNMTFTFTIRINMSRTTSTNPIQMWWKQQRRLVPPTWTSVPVPSRLMLNDFYICSIFWLLYAITLLII